MICTFTCCCAKGAMSAGDRKRKKGSWPQPNLEGPHRTHRAPGFCSETFSKRILCQDRTPWGEAIYFFRATVSQNAVCLDVPARGLRSSGRCLLTGQVVMRKTNGRDGKDAGFQSVHLQRAGKVPVSVNPFGGLTGRVHGHFGLHGQVHVLKNANQRPLWIQGVNRRTPSGPGSYPASAPQGIRKNEERLS